MPGAGMALSRAPEHTAPVNYGARVHAKGSSDRLRPARTPAHTRPTPPVPLAHSLFQRHCQSDTVTAIRWRFQVNRVSDCSCSTCKHSGLTFAVIARPLPSLDCLGATTEQQRRVPLGIAQLPDIAGLAKRRPKRGLADNLTRSGCPGSLSCRNQTDAGGGRESWETGRTLAGHSPDTRRSTSYRG